MVIVGLTVSAWADSELKQLGLETVEQARQWSPSSLVQKFGERIGTFLHQACRGLVSFGERLSSRRPQEIG